MRRVLCQSEFAGLRAGEADIAQQPIVMAALVGMRGIGEKQRVEVVFHVGTS
jgi:hypothetical protein